MAWFKKDKKPKAVREQFRVQLNRMRYYLVHATSGVVNGCHVTFFRAKERWPREAVLYLARRLMV